MLESVKTEATTHLNDVLHLTMQNSKQDTIAK